MSDLIDRDAVIREVGKYSNIGTLNEEERIALIMSIPTIDAVEVVRCRECKHYKQSESFCENGNGLWQAGDECFCSYGEREGE